VTKFLFPHHLICFFNCLAPWIRIRIEEKSGIRIRIATNADPQGRQRYYDIHTKQSFQARSFVTKELSFVKPTPAPGKAQV
jgi:hypothetical protein